MTRHVAEDLPFAIPEPADDLVALDAAPDRFANIEPQKAELVRLRYFIGLTVEEMADLLGIHPGHGQAAMGLQPGVAVSRNFRKWVSQLRGGFRIAGEPEVLAAWRLLRARR